MRREYVGFWSSHFLFLHVETTYKSLALSATVWSVFVFSHLQFQVEVRNEMN